jgi:hypothetical protein
VLRWRPKTAIGEVVGLVPAPFTTGDVRGIGEDLLTECRMNPVWRGMAKTNVGNGGRDSNEHHDLHVGHPGVDAPRRNPSKEAGRS